MFKQISTLFLAVLCLASNALVAQNWPQREFTANISSSIPDWRVHKAYNADEAQILTAVAEGLFVYDPFNMEPVPAIAESFSVSPDGLVWKFKLRSTARFETGERITAEVMRNSWLSLLDRSTEAPYASLFDMIEGARSYRIGVNTDPASVGITATGITELTLRLERPADHLLKILCHHAFSAVHPSRLNRPDADFSPSALPVSSGPYRLDSSGKEGLRFVKNIWYWDRDEVLIPSIRLVISEDSRMLTDAFNRGEIDWLGGTMILDGIYDTEAIKVSPMFATEYYFFRTEGVWADQDLRNILFLAVNWDALREGYLIPAKTLVFPIAGYPQLEGVVETNPGKAALLLSEWKKQNPEIILPELVIRIPEAPSLHIQAEKMTGAWETLGIKTRVEGLPFREYYQSLGTNGFTVGLTSWIGDFADPLAFLEMFRSDSSLNEARWKNSEFDSLLDKAAKATTGQERYQILAKAEELLLKNGVILPVSHNLSVNVIDTNGLDGWYRNPLDIHPFKFLRFVAPRALPGVARAGL